MADNAWQPYIALGTSGNIVDSCEIVSPETDCSAGGNDWYANDTDFENGRQAYNDLQGLSTNKVIVGQLCRDLAASNHVCGNGYSVVHTQALIFSAYLTIADPTAPTVGTPTGSGWTTTDWVQGTVPLSLSSSDTTGIAATRVYADGSLIATLQRSCSYTQPRPCTDEPTGDIAIPTASLTDGTHTIQVAAVDAAGNETRVTRPSALKVDNQPPAPPASLSSPAATSTSNSFSASWSLPADDGTPITAARYQLCQNSTCGAAQTSPTLTSISGLSLPAAGPATLRVWLVDQLGHDNAAGAATLTLTYSPVVTPPPTTTPAPSPPPTITTPSTTPVPVVKVSPSLKFTSLRRVGRKLTVGGTLSTRASGRVTIIYRVRLHGKSHTLTKKVTIRRHVFRTKLTLPASYAALSATVTATYSGDNDTKAQTRTTTLSTRG